MNTNKGFAPIIAIIIAVIIIAGGIGGYLYIKNKNKLLLPDYYKNLAKECESKGSYSCCISSVNNMANGNYELAPETGCPEGYRANMLECIDSFTWCQIISTSTVVTTTSETQPGLTGSVEENALGLERITLDNYNWEANGSTIIIEKDGTYTVESRIPGGFKETRKGKLTTKELDELTQVIASSKIFSLSDKYTGPTKTTRSWEQYSLIVKIGSDNKSISFNSEDETAPQVLRDIINKIMQFTE